MYIIRTYCYYKDLYYRDIIDTFTFRHNGKFMHQIILQYKSVQQYSTEYIVTIFTTIAIAVKVATNCNLKLIKGD